MLTNWCVYIVLCADNTFYVGTSPNVEARITAHNTSKSGAKYTRSRLPVSLVYSVHAGTRGDAMKLEYKLKQLTRKQKEELVYGKTD